MPDEIEIQLLYSLPVFVVIRVDRLVAVPPDRIRDRTFGNDSHVFFTRQRQGQLDRFLVGNIN